MIRRDRKPLHIALVSGSRAGVAVYTCRLASELGKAGYHVSIVLHPADADPSDPELKTLRSSCHQLHLPLACNDLPGQVAELVRALSVTHPDVVIPNFRRSSYAACAILSRRQPVRILGVCHDDDDSYYNMLVHYEPVLDGFVCATTATHRRLTARIPHRAADVRCIPHGIPLAPVRLAPPGGIIGLEYHGRLIETQKQVSHLLRLARELKARGVPFRLTLAGDGPDRQRYAAEVRRAGLVHEVFFAGNLSWDGLVEMLAQHHLSLLTSSHEGFCLSLAEAMGAGLPGIAYSCGGVVEDYLTDSINGFVVPPGDVRAMADRTEFLRNNPLEWSRLSAAARKTIDDRFAMCSFGTSYADYIAELVDGGRGQRSWPVMRPPLVPPRKSVSGLIERAGRLLGAW